jgi:cell fate regulator YaaT (PSP1 superfamily)
MAKEQNLSLNSAKISGACGRLMCCLRYEYETYLQEAKITPAVDSTVKTPEGVGTVVEANALRGLLKVSINDSVKTFKRDDVKVIAPPKQKKPVADVKNDDSQGDLD